MSSLEPPSIENPRLTENGLKVLERRYLIRDEQGNLQETPTQLFERVANFIAQGDYRYGATEAQVNDTATAFYNAMANLEFLPNSPTLMNAGRPLGQLSACFVLPVEDSMESIFETLKHTALIHQSGGGTGFSFSRLRPRGDVVRSTMGVSSGPVSFMEVYNAATEAIKQGGTRRGANMGILRIDHPDIEEFIAAKSDPGRVTNFNISVAVTDAFMKAVKADEDFPLKHPRTGKTVRKIRARSLFFSIVENAWASGEPGIVFIDRINAENPTPAVGPIEATNPCGEVPLLAYEACNLGSINLARMTDARGRIDWAKLAETVKLAVHFLDNVVTQNRFPVAEIKMMAEANRKIGLGVMGWADLLLAAKIPYDSEKALTLARDVSSWIDYQAKMASVELAKRRGPFPNFMESRFAKTRWVTEKHVGNPTNRVSLREWEKLEQRIKTYGLRNATLTCIAPTGTISIIAGVSGGIEPLFSIIYYRNIMDHTRMLEVQPLFDALAREFGFYSEELYESISIRGSVQGIHPVPPGLQRLFVTSRDIAPQWHIRMQAAFQEFTDNGVSKTINFPETATLDEIARTYLTAAQLGVKGITVYRDKSRQEQPMLLETTAKAYIGAESSYQNGAGTLHAEAVAKAVEGELVEEEPRCPECGDTVRLLEGCFICPSCAYSTCS